MSPQGLSCFVFLCDGEWQRCERLPRISGEKRGRSDNDENNGEKAEEKETVGAFPVKPRRKQNGPRAARSVADSAPESEALQDNMTDIPLDRARPTAAHSFPPACCRGAGQEGEGRQEEGVSAHPEWRGRCLRSVMSQLRAVLAPARPHLISTCTHAPR